MNIRQKCYLGIDVAKRFHQATLLDQNDNIIGQTIRFANTQDDFYNFLRQLKKHLPNLTNMDIKIGMESTGHYWYNLRDFLVNQGLNQILIINPIETQQLSKKRIRKVKNDKIDSKAIAKLIKQKDNIYKIQPNYQPSPNIKHLKKATRFCDKLKKQSAYYRREIKSEIEQICPEFEDLFSNMFLKTPLAILKKFNDLNKLKNTNNENFVEFVKKQSRGRIKKENALKILNTIRHSVGENNRNEIAGIKLKILLNNLHLIDEQIKEIENKIEDLSKNFECKKYISSIPGISSYIASVIIAEIGDVNRFKNKDKLTAYAGIDASVSESGEYKRKRGNKISKRGSKYLRKQLYYAAKTAIIFDPELEEFYQKKKAQGKHYNVILIAVARKILFRVYRIWKEKRNYEFKK